MKNREVTDKFKEAEELGRQRKQQNELASRTGQRPDSWVDTLMGRMFYRPGLREMVQHNQETQVGVPLNQFIASFAVRLSAYIGLLLLLAGTVLLVYWLGAPPSRPWMVWGLGATLIFISLVGLAGWKPRSLFIDRMDREIEEPYADHPTSELIERLIELGILDGGDPEGTTEVRVPVPINYTHDGATEVPVVSGGEPIQEGVVLDPSFADLVDFVDRARLRGLARSDWVTPNTPRAKLPSGVKVTRPVWEGLISSLIDWGVVRKELGNKYVWVEGPEQARSLLVKAAREALTYDREAYELEPAGTFGKDLDDGS